MVLKERTMIEKGLPNGVYTLQNQAGGHRTFKIWTKQGGNLEGKRMVALLTGPDNEESFTAFGFVNDNGTIYVWKNHQSSKLFVYFAKLLREAGRAYQAKYGSNPEAQAEISLELMTRTYSCLISRRCMKCNRPLTDPESIRTGMGPTCRGE
jgi:hypothetical protein